MLLYCLGRHVSTLTGSSSGPPKIQSLKLTMFKMHCQFPNAYILDITMYKTHVSLCSYYTTRILSNIILNSVRQHSYFVTHGT